MSSEPPASLPTTAAALPLDKADGAFRTIGEVAADTGIAPHILRYWEQHFPQLRPVTRAGGRRYYRPADVALIRRIDRLLNHEGYTLKGARQAVAASRAAVSHGAGDRAATLHGIRDQLAAALQEG